jgi:hypothetical protein
LDFVIASASVLAMGWGAAWLNHRHYPSSGICTIEMMA